MSTTAINFEDCNSIVRLSPMSGVFASGQYITNKKEFIERVIYYWFRHGGNTLPGPSESHYRKADELYDFYLDYRSASLKITSRRLGARVLIHLYQTGSIYIAKQELEALERELGITL